MGFRLEGRRGGKARGEVGRGTEERRGDKAPHEELSTCPGQPHLAVGQANVYANLPDNQPNISHFC